MSNDLSTLIPTVVARGLSSLREQTAMPRLVNFDYSAEAARPGDTIDVPIPAAIAAENVTPGPVPPSPPDLAPGKVQIALSNWKKAAFHLTDKEAAEITGRDGFMPMQMQEAVRALANAVNDSLHQEYRRIYTLIGTPGTTPFGSGVGILSATEARRKLNEMKAVTRRMVWGRCDGRDNP